MSEPIGDTYAGRFRPPMFRLEEPPIRIVGAGDLSVEPHCLRIRGRRAMGTLLAAILVVLGSFAAWFATIFIVTIADPNEGIAALVIMVALFVSPLCFMVFPRFPWRGRVDYLIPYSSIRWINVAKRKARSVDIGILGNDPEGTLYFHVDGDPEQLAIAIAEHTELNRRENRRMFIWS